MGVLPRIDPRGRIPLPSDDGGWSIDRLGCDRDRPLASAPHGFVVQNARDDRNGTFPLRLVLAVAIT